MLVQVPLGCRGLRTALYLHSASLLVRQQDTEGQDPVFGAPTRPAPLIVQFQHIP